jgi:CoA pyrophosphatase
MDQLSGADWLLAVARRADTDRGPELARYRIDGEPTGRPSAVLMVIAEAAGRGPDGAQVLLVQRSDRLRRHPAEVTFPGGALLDGESPAAAAVREAGEEAGLAPAGLRLIGTLPALHLAWSGFLVTPVLARWPGPAPRPDPDGAEVTRAVWVPLASLAEPAGRFQVRYPTGYVGPAFLVAGMLVWGFTGSLLGWLLRLAGQDRDFDRDRIEDLTTTLRTHGGGFGR